MSQMPPPVQPQPGAMIQPNRGGLILAFGILGIVLCAIFGVIAWIMANGDLRAMAEGRMDPSGEGLTKAGKILGIVSVILTIIVICLAILWIIVIGGLLAAGAASGAGGP